jgi:hypothetical protein
VRKLSTPDWLRFAGLRALLAAVLAIALGCDVAGVMSPADRPAPEDGEKTKAPPSLTADPELDRTRARKSRVDRAGARFAFFHQEGQGYQSQAGPTRGPGDEEIYVYQGMGAIGIETGRKLRNDLVFTLDIVTAASPDALDATTSASRETEAGDLRVTTTYSPTSKDRIRFLYGPHAEEHWWGGRVGVGYQRSLADDNATLDVNAMGIVDYFDDLHEDGKDSGEVGRWTANANLGYTQILSATTLSALSYGITFQTGRLDTSWNSVPLIDVGEDDPEIDDRVDGRIREDFPEHRLRHAFAGQLLQHVPRTRSTLRFGYRYYFDDVSLRAHTASLSWYQWMGPRVYARTAYRFHHQTGVDFYTTGVRPSDFELGSPVTADSDLAPFFAHEVGAKIVVYLRPPGSADGPPQFLDLGYRRYWRSNDLHVDMLSFGYGGNF